MYEALITIAATAFSKGIPVALSIAGFVDKDQIEEFLRVTAIMQIFILGVGLGQTASLNIDFFKGKMLRHLSMSLLFFFLLTQWRGNNVLHVLVGWGCAFAQLSYQFIENRMKVLSLYRLGRVASIYMSLAALLCAAMFFHSLYYRLLIQYLPLVVFAVYALSKYYSVKHGEAESIVKSGNHKFDYVLCSYAVISSMSLVVERQFFATVKGGAMQAYFSAINAAMILIFIQDYIVKGRGFDLRKYKFYGYVLILVSAGASVPLFFMASLPIAIVVSVLLIYTAQNAIFSLFIKTRDVKIAMLIALCLACISVSYMLSYYKVAGGIGQVVLVQWLASVVIGIAMIGYGKRGALSVV